MYLIKHKTSQCYLKEYNIDNEEIVIEYVMNKEKACKFRTYTGALIKKEVLRNLGQSLTIEKY